MDEEEDDVDDIADAAVTNDDEATLPLFVDAVFVFATEGGRLLANTGEGSMTLTKFEGKTPILLCRRPRHQPSST